MSRVFLVLAFLVSAAQAQTVSYFRVPFGDLPRNVTAGPDGNVWFCATAYTLGTASAAGVKTIALDYPYISDLTAGPDGNIWAVIEVSYACATPCFIDPTPPIALARVNLVNPAPAVTEVVRAFDGVIVRG